MQWWELAKEMTFQTLVATETWEVFESNDVIKHGLRISDHILTSLK